MFSTTISGALQGVEGNLLQVEVDVSTGMPCLEMVGLLGSEVKDVTMVRLIQSSFKESA